MDPVGGGLGRVPIASAASTAGTKTVLMPWSRATATMCRTAVGVPQGAVQARLAQEQAAGSLWVIVERDLLAADRAR